MSIILFCTTLLLDIACLLFAGAYLWINVFGSYRDLDARNGSIIRFSRVSMILSLVFAFLTSFIGNADTVDKAIAQSMALFIIIAITWLIVLLGYVGMMVYLAVSKRNFKPDLPKTLRRIFSIALPGAIIAFVMAWLFI